MRRIIKGLLALLLVSASLPGTATADGGEERTFYVSASQGDDQNDGRTPQTPWKTTERAKTADLLPGDSLLFKRGDVFYGRLTLQNIRGTAQKRITVSAYGEGERPVIRNVPGDWYKCMLLDNPSYLTVSGLAFELDTSEVGDISAGGPEGYGIQLRFYPTNFFKLKSVVLKDNRISGGGVTKKTMGIRTDVLTGGFIPGGVSDFYILDNEIENFGYFGIYTKYDDDITPGGEDWRAGIFENQRIEGNRVTNIGFTGIMISCAINSRINRNIVRSAGAHPTPVYNWAAAGIFLLAAKDSEICFNEVYDTGGGGAVYDGMGIDVDWDTENILVKYNYVKGSFGAGIGTMATSNTTITRNKLAGNQNLADNAPGAITLTDFGHGPVAGNTVSENMIIHNVNNGSAAFGSQHTDGEPVEWTGNVFRDNTVVIPADCLAAQVYQIKAKTDIASISGTRVYSPVGFRAAKWGVLYNNLSDWRAANVDYDADLVYNSIVTFIPFRVTGIRAQRQADGVSLSWNAVLGADHYNVYRSVSPDFEARYINLIGETDMPEFLDTVPREDGAWYYYKIQAENACGADGEASQAVTPPLAYFQSGYGLKDTQDTVRVVVLSNAVPPGASLIIAAQEEGAGRLLAVRTADSSGGTLCFDKAELGSAQSLKYVVWGGPSGMTPLRKADILR